MLVVLVFALCFHSIAGTYYYPHHCRLIACDPPLCRNPIRRPGDCCPTCPPSPGPPPTPTLPTAPPTLPPPPPIPPSGCESVPCNTPCPNPLPPKEGECCPRCIEDCRVILCALPICDVPVITPLGRCCPVCPTNPPTPTNLPSPKCPPGVPIAFCINAATACDEATCPNFPNARCVFDSCGGCNTKFFVGRRDVTNRCGSTTSPSLPSSPAPPTGPCPPGVPIVLCINAATACDEEICPNFRNARCVFDNCGGCNTKFFVGGREVTSECGRVGERPPSATCPPGVPIVGCINAPTACAEATCPNFPSATCIFDNCGGCDAKFFVGNRDVTRRCGDTTSPAPPPPPPPFPPVPPTGPCPPGVPIVFCINAATACDEATCPNFPNARCVFDNCGGCNTKFFIGRREVTNDCNITLPTPSPPVCPPGVPLVNCFANPCDTATCPNFPNSRCVFDTCGGCNAKFFIGRNEITNKCGGTVAEPNSRSCPPGVPVVFCLVNPCNFATCANFPNARCIFDNCGGCNARFFVGSSREVTGRCTAGGSCPIEGQIFQQCRSCPATCSNPEIACAAVCIPGCGCPDGQLIDESQRKCVDRNDCSEGSAVGHSCPIEGQVFQTCRTCPATCSNPDRICTLACEQGCGCPSGQFIDQVNRRCVSLEDCPSSNSPNRCSLPAERGPCRAFIRRYYYNPSTGKCQRFTYGGCRGNANNFRSFGECRDECTRRRAVCSQPRDPGPCEAAITRYFFDGRRCSEFLYGGCAGNDNNFRSLQECRRRCGGEISSPNKCLLPRVVGPCLAAFRRYFYNSDTKSCEPFIYGGCAGNANNFISFVDCQRECNKESLARCLLRRDPGPCRAFVPRWFYNSETLRCERFSYGGCRGNENRFSTKKECDSICHRGEPPEAPPVCTEELCAGKPNQICTLPLDTPNTVPGRSHCDVTVCRACYQSLYPLPHPRLHRSCPQIIPLFSRDTSDCSSPDLIRRWGYCIARAHRRAYFYRRENYEGSFRCYRPPYPFYG